MALDPNLSFGALPTVRPQGLLSTLNQAAPIANQIMQQQEAENLADIFSRNVQTTPEGVTQLNKMGALGELYKVDPQKALQFETAYSQMAPKEDFGLKERKLDLENRKLDLSERKLQAELDRLAKGELDPEKAQKIEGSLRSEFLKQNKDFQSVGDAYNRIQASRGQDTGASDLSLIFNYMKMLDPGSTVREGEFANAENASGVAEKTRNLYNKIMRGTRLTGPARNDFFRQTERLMDSAEKGYMRNRRTYRGLASRYNVNPANIIIDLGRNIQGAPIVDEVQAPSSPGGPPVGTVEDGYRFKGGDPSKAENWEEI